MWITALLGKATGLSENDSPVDGDGVGDGESGVRAGGEAIVELGVGLMLGLWLGLGLSGGSDTGEGVWAMMGAGEGAWAMDNVRRVRDMVSTSVARVSAIVAQGRGTEESNEGIVMGWIYR